MFPRVSSAKRWEYSCVFRVIMVALVWLWRTPTTGLIANMTMVFSICIFELYICRMWVTCRFCPSQLTDFVISSAFSPSVCGLGTWQEIVLHLDNPARSESTSKHFTLVDYWSFSLKSFIVLSIYFDVAFFLDVTCTRTEDFSELTRSYPVAPVLPIFPSGCNYTFGRKDVWATIVALLCCETSTPIRDFRVLTWLLMPVFLVCVCLLLYRTWIACGPSK